MVAIRSLLGLAVAATGMVEAQNQTASSRNSTASCDSNLNDIDTALAWGVAGELRGIGPGGELDNKTGPEYFQFLYTVGDRGTSSVSLLARPGVPFPNTTSAFTYCTISMSLPLNNLLAAQTDDGSCTQTFGADCRQHLLAIADSAALNATNSAFNANQVCHITALALNDAFLTNSTCKALNPGGDSLGALPMLFDSTGVCNTTSTSLFPGYGVQEIGGYVDINSALNKFYDDDKSAGYDRAYRTVWPHLAFPVFSGFETDGGQGVVSSSILACPRVTDMKPNATMPSALPSPSTNAASTTRMSVASNGLLGALLCLTLFWLA